MSNRILAAVCVLTGLATAGCLDDATGPTCTQVSTLVSGTSGDTVTLASGLRYIDTSAGTGVEAQSCQLVSVRYVGQLVDGTEFDRREDPYLFIPGQGTLIPGFEQGVVGMKVGGERRLIIPPSLAYGSQARVDANGDEVIPANSTLVFDVNLLGTQESAQ
jgi:FKBP-type peptidyl-prolyl cis-trans isomerase